MSTSASASRSRRVMSSSAWLASATPGRMVVREDERGGVVLQRLAHDFARMNAGAVDGAAEHLFEVDEPVAVVEVQAAEHLVGPVAQLRGEELARGRGRIHRGAGAQRLAVVAARELERRHEAWRNAPAPGRAARAGFRPRR